MKEQQYENLCLRIFDTREEMGTAAAKDAATELRRMLSEKDELNVVFAAAPSQNEVLRALIAEPEIAWNRINAFHMDEYVGLAQGDPRTFGVYLGNAVFNHLPFKSINLINGEEDPEAECLRYAELLRAHPIDLVFMGIGENGHLAFNDPPVADFKDPKPVKIVELDAVCRQQQVNDGCFPNFDAVPKNAITLTIPTLTSAARSFCVVPGERKAQAMRDMLLGPVSISCPASILRKTPGAAMYADAAAAGLL